jgi:alpha-tubulin suppressor-like RCC1 family protein
VSVGGYYCLATSSLGKVFTWGYDGSGQLGNGTNGDSSSPENITANFDDLYANEKVSTISSGGSHSIALTTLGKVFAWGKNDYGQLGDGSSEGNIQYPEDITSNFAGLEADEIVTAISGGGYHSLAVTSLGKVFSWGHDGYGQLGNGPDSTENKSTPQEITSHFTGLAINEIITSVSAGNYHSLALTSLGRVFGWGQNSNGRVGNGSFDEKVHFPEDITANFAGLETNEEITLVEGSSTGYFSCAISSLGKIFTWGSDSYGQLGNGPDSTENKSTPQDITSYFAGLVTNEIVAYMSAGNENVLVATSLGKVFAWGADYAGTIGNGPESSSAVTTPENITGNFIGLSTKELITVSAGSQHCLATSSLGKVFTWGYDGSGQLGNGINDSAVSPEDITANFSGLLYNETVSLIAGGSGFSFFLTSIGRVFACGTDTDGQLGNGPSSSSAVISPENTTANFALQ